jgi:hypothetical protein
VAYTDDTKLKKIKDLSTWKRYARGFVRIGGWLKSKGKISEDEHATYFWQGIPRTLRLRIENRLLAQDPNRSMAKPWEVVKIEAAAEAILQRDRFDRNLIDSDEEEVDETDEDDMADEGDSSDEDSDAELRWLKRKTKQLKEIAALKKSRKKSATKKRPESEVDEPRSKRMTSAKSQASQIKPTDHREVEELIHQLNAMSLNDPAYGIAYFKAIKLDRDVEKVVRRPLNGNGSSGGNGTGCTSAQAARRDPPPHLANQPPVQGGYIQRPPMRCYGCGDLGHGISTCEKINELIQNGTLARDHGGRIVKGDGTYLQRNMDKPFISVLDHECTNQLPASSYI